jgi:DNA modification methylase
MFSFVGDTVLDPFNGTGTTMIAAAKHGRCGIGVEVDADYFKLAEGRFRSFMKPLYDKDTLTVIR